MKRFNFLPVAVIALLMVVAVSCTTVQTASDGEYRDDQVTRRVVLVDPYYGLNTMLVRDATTGRYYEIEANRGFYNRYSPYGNFNDRYLYDRYYGNNNRYSAVPRNNGSDRSPQQKTEDRRRLEDAKKKILGN